MAATMKSAVQSKVAAQKAMRSAPVRASVVVRATSANTEVTRRSVMSTAAGVASLLAAAPAFASYGDSANVFGRTTNKSGFVPYSGEGFALLLPAKWNPSKEQDFAQSATTELRYEDNFDAVNNLMVLSLPTSSKSVEELGSSEKVLEQISFIFGKQAFAGQTQSEGGFAPNRVSAASLLDQGVASDKGGKKYYTYELLVRTADGDEGGRHQLIKVGVANGKLYILKIQAGDKRWFKGTKKEAFGAFDTFTLA